MSDVPAATVVPTFAPAPGAPSTVPAAASTPAAAPVDAAKPAATPAAPAAPAAAAPAKTDAPAAPKRLIADAPADAPKADAAPAKAAEAKPADWTLEAPKDSILTKDELGGLESYAKSSGLDKAKAEALAKTIHEQRAAEVGRTNDLWYSQSMSDPEIGGDKMPATVANVQRALAAYATPDERKAIANSPFANNPLFLRILNRAAGGLPSEDKIIAGGAPAAGGMPTDAAGAIAAIYGKRR